MPFKAFSFLPQLFLKCYELWYFSECPLVDSPPGASRAARYRPVPIPCVFYAGKTFDVTGQTAGGINDATLSPGSSCHQGPIPSKQLTLAQC